MLTKTISEIKFHKFSKSDSLNKTLNNYLLNKNIFKNYQNSQKVQNLTSKFQFKNTTDFGCIQSFEYLNKNYSCHYLNMANRVNNLSKNFDFKNIKNFKYY